MILCVGGLDPSGGAGLLADAEAVWLSGGSPLVSATAITVQTARGVAEVHPLAPRLVVAQVARLLQDSPPAAIKLGMLGTAAIAEALAKLLAERAAGVPLVVDPVLRSSSGSVLFDGDPIRDYRRLRELATVLTPNLHEATALTGLAAGSTRVARMAVARNLAQMSRAVVLKGGHATRDADDLLVCGEAVHWIAGNRVSGTRRGTGCRFASAMATQLALGKTPLQAARAAKALVRRYLSG